MPDSAIPSPQTRIAFEPTSRSRAHRRRTPRARRDGIVSFGQGCEGEPLLRSTTIARTIERIRAATNGTINLNTNGSRSRRSRCSADRCRTAGRAREPQLVPARSTPRTTGRSATRSTTSSRACARRRAGLRVSLNLLTHPGVTDERTRSKRSEAFLRAHRWRWCKRARSTSIPARYFAVVGRPQSPPLGMREALRRIESHGIRVGNFTHAH
jgi:hypothetical protein